MRIILRILLNAAGIYLASGIIPGFAFNGTIWQLLLAGLIFTAINLIFGNILKFLFRPLIFLSLGILALLINMGMLWLTDYFAEALTIGSISALAWGTVLMTVINIIPLKRPKTKKGLAS